MAAKILKLSRLAQLPADPEPSQDPHSDTTRIHGFRFDINEDKWQVHIKELFETEARIMQLIAKERKYVVRVFDYIPDSPLGPMILMEKLDPKVMPTFAEVIYPNDDDEDDPKAKTPFTFQNLVQMVADVGSVCDYMWKKYGLLHLDLKPKNIFVDLKTGRAYLGDFGSATAMVENRPLMIGTVNYVSPELAISYVNYSRRDPEQKKEVGITIESEVYTMAAIVYQFLTKKNLNETGKSGRETIFKIIHEVGVKKRQLPEKITENLRIALAEQGCSPATIEAVIEVLLKATNFVDEVVEKGVMRQQPQNRYPDVKSFAQALAKAFNVEKDVDFSKNDV